MKKVALLKRERINNILSDIYNYPLIIIEAPMGYGKTTAVKSFLKTKENCCLWITFQNLKETASSFWRKFSSELGNFNENLSEKLMALGFPIEDWQTEKVLSLLNSSPLKEETILVIDDFHLCSDLRINKFLLQIIAERIDNLHIVMITRDTTNIDFVELLSKGLCQVISQQKLKFNQQEIRDYCQMMTRNISDADLTEINKYTDGWISLIYMILLGIDNGIPVGMNNSIDELVEKTLFRTYDENVRNFLLKLSFMDDFTLRQAMYVTQEMNAKELLDKLQKENAFVFYDQITKTYKIHNVLLDFLRIKSSFDTETNQELYRRLGEWYLEKKDFPTAYGNLYKSGDVEQILSHLNQPEHISDSLSSFEGSFEMFTKLPKELLYQYPLAYLQHILLAIVSGDSDTISDCSKQLDEMKKAIEGMNHIDEDYRNHILAEILIFHRFTTFNVIASSGDCNEEIIRLLNGKQSYIMSKQNEFTFGSPHLLYVYFRDQGTLKHIAQLAIKRFTTYASFTGGGGAGSEYLILSEYALETGDWEAARLNSLKAIYKAKTKSQSSIIICANFTLMRLYILQGKVTESIELLRQLEEEISELNNSIYNTTIDMCKGYIYACLNQPIKIPYWLQIDDTTSADLLYQGIAFNDIIYGKSLILLKNYIALEVLTESFHEHFSIFSNQLGFLHNYIFQAIAKYRLYGMQEGIAVLKKALTIGQADKLLMPFIENAPHILDMMIMILNNDSKNEYLNNIVFYSKQYLESLKNSQHNNISLSHREVEVLTLMADGLTRDEIASRLTLSQSTVKTHLQNIYLKLDVRGKVSAIKTAQINGLI